MYKKSRFQSFFLIIFIFIFVSCKQSRGDKSITLYCASGIKPVVEKVARQYYEDYGIRVNIQYGGSGTLLSNIRVAKLGDLFLAADRSYIDEAINYGVIKETQPLAYIKPVIAVLKGNPKGIKNISDLFNENIKIAIANPEAASIGRLTKKMLMVTKQWDSLKANTTVFMPTVVEVANSVKLEAVDASIIWDATANQYDELEIVSVPLFSDYVKNITIGVLEFSKQPTEALKFLRYLSASDKGLPVFDALGYEAINGDAWEEIPELLFYSGGVNRLAIDKTVEAFKKREGAKINSVYNGCGILVSQMKSGQQPDAYLSCDVSFMTQVEDRFNEITDISKTDIIIAVKKGNPKNIQSLKDLTQNNLKLGICNHELSALGSLTKRLLEGQNIWEVVYKNVKTQTPTADLLVNQLRTDALDAVVVYEANVAQVKDKLDIVRLTEKEAIAMQNFGISNDSKNKFLTKRLLEALTNDISKKVFLDNGFKWEYKNNSSE